jgi:hypothetical protein
VSEAITILDETGRWRAREVKYWGGRWDRLRQQIPTFTTEDFRVSGDSPANPYLKSVVRQPSTLFEKAIPVGVVSPSYTLAQHSDVAEKCLEGIKSVGIRLEELDCELGLTDLGEWMNFRIYFPQKYSHIPHDKNPIRLRLECVNSVDGSSRLVILLSWLRLVCSNGLVVRETKTEISDIHNERLNLEKIPTAVTTAMKAVEKDIRRLSGWERRPIKADIFPIWINKTLSDNWGKKAACRVFNICTSGFDVEYDDPFAPDDPTEKAVKRTQRVPGSPEVAQNLFDVSQAMSWVATTRSNPEERLDWQFAIPVLIDKLAAL